MFDPHAYNITVRRIVMDDERIFEATVLELPDVRGYGPTFASAYSTAVEAVKKLHELAEADGESFPAPVEKDQEFSGRITLRTPKTLHRRLSEEATQEGSTLNTFIVALLSAGLSDYVRRPIAIPLQGGFLYMTIAGLRHTVLRVGQTPNVSMGSLPNNEGGQLLKTILHQGARA